MEVSARTAKQLSLSACGRQQDGQGMFKDAVKHMQSALVESAAVLDDDSRGDLCRCLLWYARCRSAPTSASNAQEVQYVMNSVQTVLQMQGLAKREPFVGLIRHHVISSQSIVGAVVGAAAVLLCSSWQLVLSLGCVLVAGLFWLFHFK